MAKSTKTEMMPTTAADWQLCVDTGAEDAAERAAAELTAVLARAEQLVRALLLPDSDREAVSSALWLACEVILFPVMERHSSSFGAIDTEPRIVAAHCLDRVVADCLGDAYGKVADPYGRVCCHCTGGDPGLRLVAAVMEALRRLHEREEQRRRLDANTDTEVLGPARKRWGHLGVPMAQRQMLQGIDYGGRTMSTGPDFLLGLSLHGGAGMVAIGAGEDFKAALADADAHGDQRIKDAMLQRARANRNAEQEALSPERREVYARERDRINALLAKLTRGPQAEAAPEEVQS
jgi:hypothetical protein